MQQTSSRQMLHVTVSGVNGATTIAVRGSMNIHPHVLAVHGTMAIHPHLLA
jgi:hypothetical protein